MNFILQGHGTVPRMSITRYLILFVLVFSAIRLHAEKSPPHIFINRLRGAHSHTASAEEWGKMLGGLEWEGWSAFPMRLGYVEELSGESPGMQHFGLGTRLRLWGQELQYAWVP